MLIKLSFVLAGILAIALGIFAIWPGLFGLPHSHGLAIADIVMEKQPNDKQLTYHINGNILNTTDQTLHVPTIRVTLIDTEGSPLQYWDFTGLDKTLEPHKSIPFTTGDLELRFTRGTRFVVELGNPLELAFRRKPG